MSVHSLPFIEVFDECHIKRRCGIKKDIVNVVFTALLLVPFKELLHLIPVCALNLPRLCREAFTGLEILELRISPECEGTLKGVKHVHDDYFILLMAKMLQRGENFFRIIEKVTDDNNESPAFDPVRDLMESNPGSRSISLPSRIMARFVET